MLSKEFWRILSVKGILANPVCEGNSGESHYGKSIVNWLQRTRFQYCVEMFAIRFALSP